MDRPPDSPLLERILQADRPVVLVHGPARSGKSTLCRGVYRHFLDDAGRPGCLLLAPNMPTVAQAKRALLAESASGVLIRPQVMTFDALAGRILAGTDRREKPCSPVRRHLVLRDIVDRLAADGTTPALKPLADTPGVVVALDRAIGELKRAAVEPADFARAIPASSPRLRDLHAVYHAYQDRLHREGLYDTEGKAWLARQVLELSASLPDDLGGVRAIVADGFTDFTPTQLAILQLLRRDELRLVITLPLADDGREKMWHWTARTANRIRRTFQADLVEWPLPAPAETPLQGPPRTIFALPPHGQPPQPAPAGLDAIAAAGVDAEIACVARRIKALLLEGAQAGQIAVLARSLGELAPTVERIFAEHDIPLAGRPVPLTDVPVVRFLLAVAALPGGETPFASADVLAILKSSYFRPHALGEFTPRTVAAAERTIRDANILGGRDAYRAALERATSQTERAPRTDIEDDAPSAPPAWADSGQLRHAADLLDALFALAESVTSPADLPGVADRLELAEQIEHLGDDRLTSRDGQALGTLAQAARESEGTSASVAAFREALANVRVLPPRGESLVDLLDVLDARALRWKHVFLVNANEGVFPRSPAESPMLSEADRAQLKERGISLDSRSDLTAREMLLFYLSLTRGENRLTISYQETDQAGRAAAASSFVESALWSFGGLDALETAGRLERTLPGQFLPPADQLARRRDALNAALHGLFAAQGQVDGAAIRHAVDKQPVALGTACAGLLAMHRRWREAPCDAFDGRLDQPDVLACIAAQHGPDRSWSPSRLNTQAQCPWRYFADNILRLEPLRQPSRQFEPTARGLFFHNVLCRMFALLRDACGPTVHPDRIDADALHRALDDAVAAEEARLFAEPDEAPALWPIQREQMHNQLRGYIDRLRRVEPSPGCRHFELSFGLPVQQGPLTDPASREAPVCIDTPAGPVNICGRIDRVDWLDAPEPGWFVVDYKSGQPPREADIRTGRALQVPLYAQAAEQILGQPSVGGGYDGLSSGKETLLAAFTRNKNGVKVNAAYPEQIQQVNAEVGRLVEEIRAGRFDVMPTHACPAWCPFRQVCGYSQARAERKADAADESEGRE